MALSSQLVIAPVKISIRVWPDNRRFVIRCPATSMWYMNAVPPAVSGIYEYPWVGFSAPVPPS